jgi:hypothetical protein
VESGIFFGVEFGVNFGVSFGVDFKFNIAHILYSNTKQTHTKRSNELKIVGGRLSSVLT